MNLGTYGGYILVTTFCSDRTAWNRCRGKTYKFNMENANYSVPPIASKETVTLEIEQKIKLRSESKCKGNRTQSSMVWPHKVYWRIFKTEYEK